MKLSLGAAFTGYVYDDASVPISEVHLTTCSGEVATIPLDGATLRTQSTDSGLSLDSSALACFTKLEVVPAGAVVISAHKEGEDTQFRFSCPRDTCGLIGFEGRLDRQGDETIDEPLELLWQMMPEAINPRLDSDEEREWTAGTEPCRLSPSCSELTRALQQDNLLFGRNAGESDWGDARLSGQTDGS